jgi:hypothetical protein
MADRSEVQKSAVYAALSVGGKRVLHVLEQEVGHDGVAISLGCFMERGMCRAAARYGIKQVELLGFVMLKAYLGADRADDARRLLIVRRPRASAAPVGGLAAVQTP